MFGRFRIPRGGARSAPGVSTTHSPVPGRPVPIGADTADPAGGEEPAAGQRPLSPGASGAALRAPSALREFNRYEMKYLVDVADLSWLREELADHLDTDTHGVDGGYQVQSVYYDTRDLKFYWEKIEGLRFRRKLRIRRYGSDPVDGSTEVFLEIKQRVNKVTQKRRIRMPYQDALRLCDAREPVEIEGYDAGVAQEVLGLVRGLDLRPCVTTGYRRQAYAGRDAELGLRVTIDQRIVGRDRDFRLDADAPQRFIVPPTRAIVELKVNNRAPYWLTDLTARRNLSLVRISKYCQSVEAHGLAPRSLFHVPEDPLAEDVTDAELAELAATTEVAATPAN